MGFKLFGIPLPIPDIIPPLVPDNKVTTVTIPFVNVKVVVNSEVDPLGLIRSIPSNPIVTHTYVEPPPPPPLPKIILDNVPPSPLPGPATSIGRARQVPLLNPVTFVPDVRPKTFSQDSAPGPYETLFHDFELEAIPFYNFWTPDERENDKEEKGSRNFEDIPRFIKIFWKPAPELPGIRDVLPRDKQNRPIREVKFSAEVEKPLAFTLKGISFSPEHLQPVNFSQARNSLANGHLGPGVVESVVEIPLHSSDLDSHATHDQLDPASHIQEDAFLTHPATKGVSLQELVSQVHQITNGVLGASKTFSGDMSPDAREDRDSWVDGQFSLSRSPRPGGEIRLSSVAANGPSLSIVANGAQRMAAQPVDHVLDIVDKVTQPPTVGTLVASIFNKVKFVQPNLAGVLQQDKVNMMTKPEHAESMMALAHVLPHLEIFNQTGLAQVPRQTDIPSFPAPPGLRPLEYVGYVLEKYRRSSSGVFEKVEEIEFPSREYTEYYDTKIVYGEVYRYRIRSILRWTRHNSIGPFGRETTTPRQGISPASSLSQFKSSYFGSEWNLKWAYATVLDTVPPAYPDELQVRPDSARKRITITFRLPDNPQRDIFKMRLFRKLQDESGRDLTGWSQITEAGAVDRKVDFGPQNVIYVDTDVDFFQKKGLRYVYTTQCVTRHGESSAFSEQLAARLNEDHKNYGEFPTEFVSCGGVKPEHFGSFATYPIRRIREEIVIKPEESTEPVAFAFQGRSATSNSLLDSKKYWVRVESLDTGEVRDHTLEVTYNNLKPHISTQVIGVYVKPHSLPPPKPLRPVKDPPPPLPTKGDKVRPLDKPRPGEQWKPS